MVGCAVKSCRRRQYKGSGIHFFSFPTDPLQRRAWVEKISRHNFKPTAHSRVCSIHFENSCFEKDPAVLRSIDWKLDRPKIKHDAVPTIALGSEGHSSKEEDTETRPMLPTLNGSSGNTGSTDVLRKKKIDRLRKLKRKKCQVRFLKFVDRGIFSVLIFISRPIGRTYLAQLK